MLFIGREKELNELNKRYNKGNFEFFVLYGRRRIGKTTLLKEFCNDKESFFFSAEQASERVNIDNFTRIICDYYNESNLFFNNFVDIIIYIVQKSKDKRMIVVIDEFPYLCEANKKLLSELQHLIDMQLKNTKLFIVISGSYMGFMEKNILSSKSPIYGRRTGQMLLRPLSYDMCIKCFNKYSLEDAFKLYGMTGGVPLYIKKVLGYKNFKDVIMDAFLNSSGYFFDEPIFLLKEEVDEPKIYQSILYAIASGHSKINEIATFIGEMPAKCMKYINVMINLELIDKKIPISEKDNSRKSIYKIKDNVFKFYYRYVLPNKAMLISNGANVVYEKIIKMDYDNYMGNVFEDICKEYLTKLNALGKLPFIATKIDKWWGTNKKLHKEQDIDVVCMDKDKYIFSECKWRNELFKKNIYKDLIEKSKIFGESNANYFYLFSKSGFEKNFMLEIKKSNNVKLIKKEELLNY